MKQQDIHNLIERFLDAETTLQEEKQLMEYFRQEDIPEELMQYREMFLDYEALATSYSTDEKEPVYTPETTITTVELSRRKQPPRIMLWTIAASIALLIAVGAGFLYNINKVEETPQLAKAESQPVAIPDKEDLPEVVPIETARTTEKSIIANTPTKARLNATPQAEDYEIPEESSTSRGIELPTVTITPKSMASTATSESMDEIFATTMPDLANTQISTDEFNATIREKGMALSGKILTLISE